MFHPAAGLEGIVVASTYPEWRTCGQRFEQTLFADGRVFRLGEFDVRHWKTVGTDHAVQAGMLDPGAFGPVHDARAVPPAVTCAPVDLHLLLGCNRDLVSGVGNVELGQKIDAVLQSTNVDVGICRDQSHASVVRK